MSTLRELVEQLCDCDGRRLNGRARELANEIRESLAEAALRAATPAPREPKLTISDLDEILGGYDSAHVTRGTVLQRLNEWLRIRAAGELEQAK